MNDQQIEALSRPHRISVEGIFEVKRFGPDGELLDHRIGHNLIPTAGLANLAGRCSGDVSSNLQYIAIGTNTTAAAAGDTALGTELARISGTRSRVTTTVTNDTFQLVATFAAGTGTGAVREYGVFDTSSGSSIVSRWVDSGPTQKNAADTLQVTYTQKYANG